MADNETSSSTVYVLLKALGWAVSALMALAIVYAGVISISNWTQIAV